MTLDMLRCVRCYVFIQRGEWTPFLCQRYYSESTAEKLETSCQAAFQNTCGGHTHQTLHVYCICESRRLSLSHCFTLYTSLHSGLVLLCFISEDAHVTTDCGAVNNLKGPPVNAPDDAHAAAMALMNGTDLEMPG